MNKPILNLYIKEISETKYVYNVSDRFDIRYLTTTTCNFQQIDSKYEFIGANKHHLKGISEKM